MRTSRRLLAVPVALALAGTLGGCAGSSSPTAESRPPAAVQSVEPAPAKGAAFVLTADNFAELGAQASAAKSYRLSMSFGFEGESTEMTGAVNGTDSQITETVPGLDTPVEIRVVGGVVYANLGAGTGGLFWQVDPADSSALAYFMTQATDQASVALRMSALKSAIVSVTPVGAPEEIDGVSSQPYEIVVDTTKMTGQAAEQFATAEARAGVEVPDQFTYTYWVGTDKLLRKMTLEVMGGTTEMLFSHWGEPVTIEAPAADQITTTSPTF